MRTAIFVAAGLAGLLGLQVSGPGVIGVRPGYRLASEQTGVETNYRPGSERAAVAPARQTAADKGRAG